MLSTSSRAIATIFTSSYPVDGCARDVTRASGAKARTPPTADWISRASVTSRIRSSTGT